MVYIITGGPGFGKTTVINLLAELNFPVCQENARELLASYQDRKGVVDRNKFPVDFEKNVAKERINFLLSIADNTIAFSDRGLPDQIAYSRCKNKMPSNYITENTAKYKYAQIVFVAPPWEEIFVQDDIRNENFKEASAIHEQILNAYSEYNYKIINLPLVNPRERVRFILNFLGI